MPSIPRWVKLLSPGAFAIPRGRRPWARPWRSIAARRWRRARSCWRWRPGDGSRGATRRRPRRRWFGAGGGDGMVGMGGWGRWGLGMVGDGWGSMNIIAVSGWEGLEGWVMGIEQNWELWILRSWTPTTHVLVNCFRNWFVFVPAGVSWVLKIRFRMYWFWSR